MKVLFCDCFSGISGDMLLGALLDAGVNEEQLRTELAKLGIEEEYSLHTKRVVKKGISATDVQVELIPHTHNHAHTDTHYHTHNRNLFDIAALIDKSMLDTELKARAKYVFQRLGKAEAKIHNTTIDKVHFHEVGAVDAIVDICGNIIALALLGIERVYCSPLPTGSGFIECAHGVIPVPAPATAELLQNIPIYDPGIEAELVTPTGAALITSLAEEYGKMPAMNVQAVGYGAGNKDFGLPNVLRVFVGELPEEKNTMFNSDSVYVLETNIDDCSPEILGHLWDKVLDAGALDMFYTPIFMKKGRPANLLTIITDEESMQNISNTVFNETSTIGIRYKQVSRYILNREVMTLNTTYGNIRYKHSGNNVKPEFEDLKIICDKLNIPLKEAYHQAMSQYYILKSK